MNALVVGAGAVGQVLAAHLQRGGARITLLVKDKHAAEARRGFTLRALHKQQTLTLTPDEVLTSTAEAAAQKWDLILLCMSSTALKSGTWLEELAQARGPFVAIQPGLEDPEFVAARVGKERLVWGMFPLVAFADGDHLSYWLPPLGKLPFSGPQAQLVVEGLARGGLPSRVDKDVPTTIAFSGPLLEVLVIALELAGWKLASIGPHLREALTALREALAIVASQRHKRAPFLMKLLRPWMLRLLLPISRLAPFSVEEYVKNHFTKVGDQTVAGLDTFIRHAKSHALPADALTSLGQKLQARRAA